MQYILSQEEFNALQSASRELTDKKKKQLQELCTAAAMHVPVTIGYFDTPLPVEEQRPWGCILVEDSGQDVCDLCPARTVCPCDHKELSK